MAELSRPVPAPRPAVSVLMPAYNAERWIDGCLDSVLSQGFRRFELVVVDDASRDGTAVRLAAWASRDPRVRVVRNEANQGVARSLNRGLSECRGELVLRMDADDLMREGRIEKQVAFLASNPGVHVLGGWARVIDSAGGFRELRRMPVEHRDIVELIWANPIIHPSVAYRRDAILALGGYDERARQREDYDLWFRCAAAGLGFHNLPEPLIDYRHDHESFRRYDFAAAWRQFLIGARGCWRLGAGSRAYLGLAVPLVRSALPTRLRLPFYALSKRFDPRERA